MSSKDTSSELRQLEELIGPRCETPDYIDFPDLKPDERCAGCEMWDAIDAYVAAQKQRAVVEARKDELKKAITEYNRLQEYMSEPSRDLKFGNGYILGRIAALDGVTGEPLGDSKSPRGGSKPLSNQVMPEAPASGEEER